MRPDPDKTLDDINEKTFLKITNKDLYDELQELKSLNTEQHNEIIGKQDKTNGKVKLSMWIATTAITLVVITITLLVQHMSNISK